MNDVRDAMINGEWRPAHGEAFVSNDPVRGSVTWEGRAADTEDVASACDAARTAFANWYRAGPAERENVVRRFGERLDARRDEFARLMAGESGKALWDCRTEIGAALGKIDISVRAFHDRTGHTRVDDGDGTRELRHKPHGVVAVFGPFNFPVHLPNGHIVPALLAGNTVVFKPSEMTPACAALYAECWREAGLPPGVLNVINGARDTGAALLANDGIDGVFFTGSAATGAAIHRQFGGDTRRILALELGGNNPLVIADADDVGAAALITIQSAYVTAGQRCTCARRLIVVDTGRNRALVDDLLRVMNRVTVGDPLAEPQPFYGSLISNRAADAVLAFQQRLLDAGATALRPCERIDDSTPLLKPGLLDVSGVSDPPDEEAFGPLLQVTWVADLDEAIAAANRTRFGLSAGILTEDDETWERFIVESRAGVVNRNLPLTGASSTLPFGGTGASGNARPSAYYAADYCAWPVATMTRGRVAMPATLPPGIES